MATSISEKMGGPHIKDSLTLWTKTASPTSSHVYPFCNKLHNSRDSLVNHIQFHYWMVLVCPICGGCGSNQWRTVEGHIKMCAIAQPNITSRKVEPGKPHWRGSDPPLMNHTWAPKTEAMFTLPVWPNPLTMRSLYIEARSSNAFARSGKPKLPPSRRLWLQKLRRSQ